MQQRIFKQLLILILIAGLLAPVLGVPGRVVAQDEGSPDPAVLTAPDAMVDPQAVYEDPPPEDGTAGGKEVRLGAVERTYIASGQAGTNFDSAGRLRLGYSIADGQAALRTLIRFDLGSIPRGVHVYSAQMELNVISSEPPADPNQSMGIKVMAVDGGPQLDAGQRFVEQRKLHRRRRQAPAAVCRSRAPARSP